MAPRVYVDRHGRIVLDGDEGDELTQAEAIDTAIELVEAVRRSRDLNQLTEPSYHSTENIVRRMESPLGQALSALKRVF